MGLKQTPLQLDPRVLEILDGLAREFATTRGEFFRLLLSRKLGVVDLDLQRVTFDWKRPGHGHPLANEDVPTVRWLVSLPPELEAVLEKLCYMVGDGRPSTIASHLILEVLDISPLSRGFAGFSLREKQEWRTRSLVGGKFVSRRIGCTFDTRVLEILQRATESQFKRSPSAFVEAMLQEKVDEIKFLMRVPQLKGEYLRPEKHEKRPYNLTLLVGLADTLDEACRRLGQGDRGTVLSHYILQRVGISPLEYEFTLDKLER